MSVNTLRSTFRGAQQRAISRQAPPNHSYRPVVETTDRALGSNLHIRFGVSLLWIDVCRLKNRTGGAGGDEGITEDMGQIRRVKDQMISYQDGDKQAKDRTISQDLTGVGRKIGVVVRRMWVRRRDRAAMTE